MAVLLGGPILVLVQRSFDTAGGYSFGFYRALSELRRTSTIFVPPIEAVRNSVVFASIATVIALVIGGLAAFAVAGPRRGARAAGGLDTLLLLPLGVSAVTIGFGFLIALDRPPFDLRASPALIPIAHALVAAPFVARVMIPVLRSIDERLREAAAVLGASPGRVWREIDLPIVARAVLVAAGFAFAISLGEFGATIFIARPDYPTLPVVIFRLLGQPGALNFGAAMAASVILMAVTAVAILAIERFRFADIGEFSMLRVESLEVRYGDTVALDGVDLDVGDGEVVSVLGPSGSGKSTLLRAVAGLEPPVRGRVEWDGDDLTHVAPHRRQLGLMFQDHTLFPHRDVLGNVVFGLRMRSVPATQAASRASELLDAGGVGRVRASAGHRAVGRRAAAGRAGPGARARPAPAHAGRAAGIARPRAAGAADGRAARFVHPTRAHVVVRHPRPRRGLCARRPGRGHARRPHRAARLARRRVGAPDERVRRALPRIQRHRRRSAAAASRCVPTRCASTRRDRSWASSRPERSAATISCSR